MNNIKKLCVTLCLFILLVFLASCSEPSPLYGTWADNRGNTFSFFTDNTFNARISAEDYTGNFILLMNVLTLNCTNIEFRIVTEWDIRGNILYLDWKTTESNAMTLSLFKISN